MKISLRRALLVAVTLAILPLILVGCASEEDETPDESPSIVLVTDFGPGDYRVGGLKGAIVSAYPDARILDATHGVPAFDVATGAFILNTTAAAFPADTIFVGAVAPGGSATFLAVTTDQRQVFVVPDNGIITLAARESGISSANLVSNEDLFSQPIEDIGVREIMGTVAGLLASGLEPASLGPSVSAPQMLELQDATIDGASLVGSVVYVDNFGNSLTNIDTALLSELGLAAGQSVGVVTPEGAVQAILGWSYGDVPRGDPVVLLNPGSGLELAINFGNFSEAHGVQSGSAIRIMATP